MKNKVSFDFDLTLSLKSVQKYAKELLDRGVEVWIITSRKDNKSALSETYNDDLFKVADEVGISRDNIIFTCYKNKSDFLDDSFLWHLDDDVIELSFVKTDTNVYPVCIYNNQNWREDCENFFKYEEK